MTEIERLLHLNNIIDLAILGGVMLLILIEFIKQSPPPKD